MSVNNDPNSKDLSGAKKEVKEKVSNLYDSLKTFLISLVSVKDEIDYHQTHLRIEDNIKFQGFNVWVLICSIFIASIGLNSNSTAIIIGAMLISPLMGPIVGIGFSLGTNRFDLLKRSVLNFVIMMLVALITSTMYFFLTPLDKADTEILARTAPTILDVLVALFGGLAGAISLTKKNKGLTVVPGVAIATALMPPLCTVGYGLATWQPEFAFGAMYLFLLNSVIISISTTVFVRIVQFPLHTFVDQKVEKRAKVLITLFLIVLIVPSVLFFVSATRKSYFDTNATNFVQNEIYQANSFIISQDISFNKRENSTIIILMGGEMVPDSTLNKWELTLMDYGLTGTDLIIQQDVHNEHLSDKIRELERSSMELNEINKTRLNAMIIENRIELRRMDSIIKDGQVSPELTDSMQLDFGQICAEIETMYTGVKKVAYGEVAEYQENRIDTVPVIFINWDRRLATTTKNKQVIEMRKWLRVRTHNPHIEIRQYLP